MKSKLSWHTYFLDMLDHISSKSKDKNTKVGCVIVGKDNEIRSTGYNSFPRGLNDDVPTRQIRPEKYFWFEHAERNAIYNAALVGIKLKGCRIYLNGIPCVDCARAIIQCGIKKVIIYKSSRNEEFELRHNANVSSEMLEECGVKLVEVE